MKRSNVITFVCLMACIFAACGLIFWRSISFEKERMYVLAGSMQNKISMAGTEALGNHSGADLAETGADTQQGEEGAETLPDVPAEIEFDMEALFIGDSRTVGFWEYAGMEDVDFFATVGMTVFEAKRDEASVPGTGTLTLGELLEQRTYRKIHIMLGINELGDTQEEILKGYEALLDFVKERQPDAAIFMQANLHVTEKRSQSDSMINNGAIDRLNGSLSGLAAQKDVFYLDANELFDDGNGNLDPEKSQDNVHLYAKYYAEWGQWILQQMDAMISE